MNYDNNMNQENGVAKTFGTGNYSVESAQYGWKILGREKGEGFPRATVKELYGYLDSDLDKACHRGRLYFVDADPETDDDDSGRPLERVRGFQGVRSDKYNKVFACTTTEHKPVTHISVIKHFLDELEMAGVKSVQYNYEEGPGTFRMGVWLDHFITPADGHNCRTGFVLSNNNRGEGSVDFSGAYIRMICQNFMMHGYFLGNFRCRHTGDMKLKLQEFSSFLRELDFRGEKVLTSINRAIARELDLDTAKKLLDCYTNLPVGFRDITFNDLATTKAKVGKITWYDMYNSMTHTLSHSNGGRAKTIDGGTGTGYSFQRMCELGNITETILIDFGEAQIARAAENARKLAEKAKKGGEAADALAAQKLVQNMQTKEGGPQ